MNDLSPDLLEALAEGRTVLVSSPRTARAIRLGYARHARALGQAVWRTPDVLTAAAWLERSFLRNSAAPGPRLRLLSSAHTAALWDIIVARSSATPPLVNAAAAARSAAEAWALAQAWHIDLAGLAHEPGEEAQAFAAWTAAFEAECARQHWLPRPRLPRWLAAQGRAREVHLFVSEPEELVPSEVQLLDVLRDAGADIRLGVRPVTSTRTTGWYSIAARDAEEELLHAAEWARAQVESGAQAVGVVVSDLGRRLAAVERAFADAFDPGVRLIGQPSELAAVDIAAARPLAEYPLVRTALDLLALAGGRVSSPIAGTLLRSPFLAGAESEASLRALADVRLRRYGREHVDIAALEHLMQASRCNVAVERLQALSRLSASRARRASPSAWGEYFLEVWTACGWPGPRALSSAERQTLDKLHEGLGVFGALEEVLPALTFEAARSEFGQLVARTPFEPRAGAGRVTVIDPQSVLGMQFDALWLAGATAARWPPPPDPDPFLPVAWQIRAGVPQATATGMQHRSRRRFDRIVTSAPTVVASWSSSDGDARDRPSPWIVDWTALDAAAPRPRGYRHTLFAARPVLDRTKDGQAPAIGGGRARGGARIAELQSLCPFRAQAELRLGATPLPSVAPGVGPLERGQLAHRVLDELWRRLGSQARLAALDDGEIEALVRHAVARHAQPLYAGASGHHARLVEIESVLARARVLELLRLERTRMPFRVFEQPERAETASIGGLDIDLRIDRIDELADGGVVVLDYKTGAADVKGWYGERPRQPQLPLYATAHRDRVAAVAFALLSSSGVGFAGAARAAGVLPGVEASGADWERQLDAWRDVVTRLIASHAAGAASVDPLRGACRYCHLRTLCRIDEEPLRAESGGNDDV